MNHMRYLGIDYGKRKIGLATSEGMLASPYKVVQISGLEDALKKIQQLIDQEKIDQVVIGLPESGEARSITKKFINALKTSILVHEADETLSSHQAGEDMLEMNASKKSRRVEDAYAASLILQNFLDNRNN